MGSRDSNLCVIIYKRIEITKYQQQQSKRSVRRCESIPLLPPVRYDTPAAIRTKNWKRVYTGRSAPTRVHHEASRETRPVRFLVYEFYKSRKRKQKILFKETTKDESEVRFKN